MAVWNSQKDVVTGDRLLTSTLIPSSNSSDVAWSYSRSQAQPQGLTAPSFTERHWAGPSHEGHPEESDGLDSDALDDEEEEEDDEDEEIEVIDDDREDIGIVQPPSGRLDRRNDCLQDDELDSGDFLGDPMVPSQPDVQGLKERRPSLTRPWTSPSSARHNRTLPRDRQVSRLTNEESQADEPSRSRSRSPKRVAASSRSEIGMTAESSSRARGRDREGLARGRDGPPTPQLKASASDFPRVGSHHERYSMQRPARERRRVFSGYGSPSDEEDEEKRSKLMMEAGNDQAAPLLTRRASKSVSPSFQSRGRTKPSRGREPAPIPSDFGDRRSQSRSDLINGSGSRTQYGTEAIGVKPAAEESILSYYLTKVRQGWQDFVVGLLPCCGKRSPQ